MESTYYEILGVAPTATQDEIKRGFRNTARKEHPDRNPGDEEAATKRFQAAEEAYRILSDQRQRASYDVSLKPQSEPDYEPPWTTADQAASDRFRDPDPVYSPPPPRPPRRPTPPPPPPQQPPRQPWGGLPPNPVPPPAKSTSGNFLESLREFFDVLVGFIGGVVAGTAYSFIPMMWVSNWIFHDDSDTFGQLLEAWVGCSLFCGLVFGLVVTVAAVFTDWDGWD